MTKKGGAASAHKRCRMKPHTPMKPMSPNRWPRGQPGAYPYEVDEPQQTAPGPPRLFGGEDHDDLTAFEAGLGFNFADTVQLLTDARQNFLRDVLVRNFAAAEA